MADDIYYDGHSIPLPPLRAGGRARAGWRDNRRRRGRGARHRRERPRQSGTAVHRRPQKRARRGNGQIQKRDAGAKEAPARLAQKESELEARYQAEYTRVTGLLLNGLKRAVNGWLKENKKGIKIVLPASAALGFAQSADISGEILRRLNAAAIDFGKK